MRKSHLWGVVVLTLTGVSMRTMEEFKQAKKNNITRWSIYLCSLCGYDCGYIFDGENVSYDSGCYCVTYCPCIKPRSWEDVADYYNMQKNENHIAKMDLFWGFVD
jgi:hypothetical protein